MSKAKKTYEIYEEFTGDECRFVVKTGTGREVARFRDDRDAALFVEAAKIRDRREV